MAEAWIEAIGLFAGVLGIIAWIPQIREVWVNKRHDGISLATFSVVTVALGLWLLYGILVDSISMIIANIMTLAVIFAVIIGVVRLRRQENSSCNQQTDLVVSMITVPILYGSPFEAGLLSSKRPTHPSVGTDAGTRIDAPRSETPYENWSID